MTSENKSTVIQEAVDEVVMFLAILNEYALGQQLKEIAKSCHTTSSDAKKAEKDFFKLFESFCYRFSYSEVFSDFLNYGINHMQWWQPKRDFTYFEVKYEKQYPQFFDMYDLLSIASDPSGQGFHDALGDLFMDLVVMEEMDSTSLRKHLRI